MNNTVTNEGCAGVWQDRPLIVSLPPFFFSAAFSLFCFSFALFLHSLAKKISEMWKAVSASEKTKFEKAAADDKKRHEKELADYKARGGGADDDEAPKRKSKNTARTNTSMTMSAACGSNHWSCMSDRLNFLNGIARLHPPTRTHLFLCSFVLVCRGCPGQEGCCR